MRNIDAVITGEFINKSSKSAGVQGEGNVTTLTITFDASWDAFAKRVIWRDARGENPVAILLGPDSLVEGRTYLTSIPAEPLALPGWCTFSVDGYLDAEPDKIQKSVQDCLEVKPNFSIYQPAEPTPTQAQQLLEELEVIKDDVLYVRDSVPLLEQARDEAAASAAAAGESESNAAGSATEAASSADEAGEKATAAAASATEAASFADAASMSASEAEEKASDAEASAVDALASASNAEASASAAAASQTQAQASVTAAGLKALDAEAWAVGQRGGADVETDDPAYHNNAKYYSQAAQEIIDTGDFASKTEAQGYVDAHASSGIHTKMLTFEGVEVLPDAWTADTAYLNWGFRAAVVLSDVTADMTPTIVLDPDTATAGLIAPIAESYAGGLYLYASEALAEAIAIPAIIMQKAVN